VGRVGDAASGWPLFRRNRAISDEERWRVEIALT